MNIELWSLIRNTSFDATFFGVSDQVPPPEFSQFYALQFQFIPLIEFLLSQLLIKLFHHFKDYYQYSPIRLVERCSNKGQIRIICVYTWSQSSSALRTNFHASWNCCPSYHPSSTLALFKPYSETFRTDLIQNCNSLHQCSRGWVCQNLSFDLMPLCTATTGFHSTSLASVSSQEHSSQKRQPSLYYQLFSLPSNCLLNSTPS